MTATLLFGNGFNRAANENFNWERLITEGSRYQNGLRPLPPLPLVAEAVAAEDGKMLGSSRGNAYDDFRGAIAQRIEEANLEDGPIHQLFRTLGFDYFVTTNYDTCFECSGGGWKKLAGLTKEDRHILCPVGMLDGKPFFHAHGTQGYPRTICASYEHYLSLVTKIRKELRCGEKVSKGGEDPETSDVRLIERFLSDDKNEELIWPSLFFTSDMYIVGLSLDYSEIDLWWLLSLRTAFFAPLERRERANSITYYDVKARCGNSGDGQEKGRSSDDREKDADSSKYELLRSLGVKPEIVEAQNYDEGYAKIAHMIEKKLR